MSIVFVLIISPFVWLIVHFTTKLLFDNKEAIIMIQDKIQERMKEPVIDDIMDEVKLYDAIVEPVKEIPKVKKGNKSFVHKPKKCEAEIRNDLLKGLAIIGLSGISAWWSLMSPVLYVPTVLITSCWMSYKFGEWKGREK